MLDIGKPRSRATVGNCLGARPPRIVLRTTQQCLRRPYVQTEILWGPNDSWGWGLILGGRGEESDKVDHGAAVVGLRDYQGLSSKHSGCMWPVFGAV